MRMEEEERYFDDDEARTAAVGAFEVDGGLVVGDVEALDGGSAR